MGVNLVASNSRPWLEGLLVRKLTSYTTRLSLNSTEKNLPFREAGNHADTLPQSSVSNK